jgi:peptide chain release factor subunit 1
MVSHDKYVTVFELIEPPEPIMSFKYNCDSSFYLEPLKAMLVDKAVYGLIVIDRSEATLGYLRGKRIIPIKNVQSLVPSKHSRGGQSARRFERLIEQAAHEFFKKVATLANENFVGNRELRGILVGGPGATKEYFVEKDYLHHELRKLIIDTFDTGYTNESGLRELVDKASETLTELGILREKQLLARFVREVVKADGGLAVYGDAEVRHALLMGAIDTLLISELVQKYRLKLECNSCRHTQEVTVDKANLDSWRCPNCDKSSLRIIERHNIVSELSEQAEAVGTKVELISPDTDDGALLYSAFGGIAAILRYKIKYQ